MVLQHVSSIAMAEEREEVAGRFSCYHGKVSQDIFISISKYDDVTLPKYGTVPLMDRSSRIYQTSLIIGACFRWLFLGVCCFSVFCLFVVSFSRLIVLAACSRLRFLCCVFDLLCFLCCCFSDVVYRLLVLGCVSLLLVIVVLLGWFLLCGVLS